MCCGVIFVDFTYESSDTTFYLKYFLKFGYLLNYRMGIRFGQLSLLLAISY